MTGAASVPDVTVVVPVYNTMPYLTACLESLVSQSIGLDRLEVVAVDDGSFDGSGEELDRFATDYPQTFQVLHQANSGGPAEPCNRGLEVATGRYVFFLGADDFLGEEALERLVAKADEWASDVIFGRMEGVGGRVVHQAMFKETRSDVDFLSSDLAFAISNTKLFRRSLVQEHRLRYSQNLRVGSDQPFAIAAMLRAGRVSVLSDYTYYYAVRRHDATNITYSSSWRARLQDIGSVMRHVADLVEPGALRDAVLRRHFAWELAKLLKADFLVLSADEQQELIKGIGALADAFLTERISHTLWSSARARLRMAQHGALDRLIEVVAHLQAGTRSPLVLEGDRIFSALPGFRDGCPDEWFEVTSESIWDRLAGGCVIDSLTLDGAALDLGGVLGVTPQGSEHVSFVLEPYRSKDPIARVRRYDRGAAPALPAMSVVLTRCAGGASALAAHIPLSAVVDSDAPPGRRWSVRVRVDAGPWTFDMPVRMTMGRQTSAVRKRLRGIQLVARTDDQGLVFVRRKNIPLSEVARSGHGERRKK